MTAITTHRRDRLDSQNSGSGAPHLRVGFDWLDLTELSIIINSRPKYDSWELGKSVLGSSKTYTTDAEWNTGTTSNVTVSSGSITATAPNATWTSGIIYWSDSSMRETVDNFNGLMFNGDWDEDANSGMTWAVTNDPTFTAQGDNSLLFTGSGGSDTVELSKTFTTAITFQDKIHILRKGNFKISFP